MSSKPAVYVTASDRWAPPIAAKVLLAASLCATLAVGLRVACAEPAADSSTVAARDEFIPQQDTLPVPPPADAIVLFDGRATNDFVSMSGGRANWPVEDGALVSTPNARRSNNLVSRLHFRDADVHVEFQLPADGDGNSGIYLHGLYEMQILNSFGTVDPGAGDIGGVYSLHPPEVNAARKPGEWQVYDIRYRAPRRDARGKITVQGSITAWLNGHCIQNHVAVGEKTSAYNPYQYDSTPYLQQILRRLQQSATGPLVLQDHDNPVRFRNIWVRPLDDRAYRYREKQ